MKQIIEKIDKAYEEEARWFSCVYEDETTESKRNSLRQAILWRAYADLMNDMRYELAELIAPELVSSED